MLPRDRKVSDLQPDRVEKPTDEKDENEIVNNAENVVDTDSFTEREPKRKRRHDSPADISNPGTI